MLNSGDIHKIHATVFLKNLCVNCELWKQELCLEYSKDRFSLLKKGKAMDLAFITSHIYNCWCFCFGSVSSFFLELFLHWSPVAYWAPTNLGSSSFSVLSFCLFILFMGFSRQEHWSGLPFLPPVDHILSELSTMTCPSRVALRGMAPSFIELDNTVVHVIRLASFLWLWFSFCLLSDGEG